MASREGKSQRVYAPWTRLALHIPLASFLREGMQVEAKFHQVGVQRAHKNFLINIRLPRTNLEVRCLSYAVIVNVLTLAAVRKHDHSADLCVHSVLHAQLDNLLPERKVARELAAMLIANDHTANLGRRHQRLLQIGQTEVSGFLINLQSDFPWRHRLVSKVVENVSEVHSVGIEKKVTGFVSFDLVPTGEHHSQHGVRKLGQRGASRDEVNAANVQRDDGRQL